MLTEGNVRPESIAKEKTRHEPFNQQYFVLQNLSRHTKVFLRLPYITLTTPTPVTTKSPANFVNQLNIDLTAAMMPAGSPVPESRTPNSANFSVDKVRPDKDADQDALVPIITKPPPLLIQASFDKTRTPENDDEQKSYAQHRRDSRSKPSRKQDHLSSLTPKDGLNKPADIKLPPLPTHKPAIAKSRSPSKPSSRRSDRSRDVTPSIASPSDNSQQAGQNVLLGDVLAAAAANRARAKLTVLPSTVESTSNNPKKQAVISSLRQAAAWNKAKPAVDKQKLPPPPVTKAEQQIPADKPQATVANQRSVNPQSINKKSNRQTVAPPQQSVLAEFDDQFKRLTDLYNETYRLLAKC